MLHWPHALIIGARAAAQRAAECRAAQYERSVGFRLRAVLDEACRLEHLCSIRALNEAASRALRRRYGIHRAAESRCLLCRRRSRSARRPIRDGRRQTSVPRDPVAVLQAAGGEVLDVPLVLRLGARSIRALAGRPAL